MGQIFVPKRGTPETAMAMERLVNVSDEVKGGRSNVRVEEEWVERGGGYSER